MTDQPTLTDELKNDPDSTRMVAASVVDPAATTPEVWCRSMRLYQHALLATPQPARDWSIVASGEDARARLAALPQLFLPLAVPLAAQPAESFASRVLRRVRPNLVWSGPTEGLETAISVRCSSNGLLLSATVLRPSGNPAWDAAALLAVQRSDPMPLDADGHVPRDFIITVRPAS